MKERITTADQQVHAQPLDQPAKRRRFTLPTAHTILFATGIASGFAGSSISEGIVGRLVILLRRDPLGGRYRWSCSSP